MNRGCCNTIETPATGDQATPARRVGAKEVFRPAIDIFENDEGYTVLADLPGVREQDLQVQFEDGTLTITGRVAGREPNGRRALLREYGVGDFERSFRIGEGIDVEKIAAELHGGVLTLRLPKAERVKPRKIEVRTTTTRS